MAAPAKAVSPDRVTPQIGQVAFGRLYDEIRWVANRSATRWIEEISSFSYPVEHAEVVEREAKLFDEIRGLGVDMPNYGDGRWRNFGRRWPCYRKIGTSIARAKLLKKLGPPRSEDPRTHLASAGKHGQGAYQRSSFQLAARPATLSSGLALSHGDLQPLVYFSSQAQRSDVA